VVVPDTVAAMKFALISLAILAGASASATKEHPIGKIIGMIEELMVKAQTQAEEEAAANQKFEYWCKTTTKELTTAITKGKEQVEVLEDTIAGLKKQIEKLEVDIAALEKQIGEIEAAAAKAEKIREDEEKTYTEADADFKETISAIQEVIDGLEDAKKGASLLETSVTKVLNLASMFVSEHEQKVLSSFLQEARQPKKPKAKGYTFKSQGVIELLKKLKEKFETDQLETTKAETNSLNSYNLAKQAREEAKEAAEKSKTEKEEIKGEAEGDLTDAESDLELTKKDLADNEASLETVTADCQTKADEYSTRSAARENEIKAMEMAIKILAKVGGVRAPEPKEFLQGPSFLQIDDPKMKGVQILVAEAQKLHSKSLKRLAQQITAHLSGPFDEINQMIQKMIFRLMAEQKDEDDHKNWCDLELEKSTESRDDKAEKKETLEDKIAEAKAKVVELTEQVVTLEEEVAGIIALIQKATEDRETEKAENMATIKDAKDAQDAIAQAIAVLEDFYKEQGAFVQIASHEPVEVKASPDTWESESTGLQNPDGVLDMMKTISADFAEMEATTTSDEETAQKDYDELVTQESITKAGKEQEILDKNREKGRLNGKIKTWSEKHKHVTKELEAVEQYLKDLVPACGAAEEGEQNKQDYEDRKKARADEIEALRKAQTILEEAFKEKPEFLQRRTSINRH
jgi:DNA repair exonuclease SbcCD ATPase subunit